MSKSVGGLLLEASSCIPAKNVLDNIMSHDKELLGDQTYFASNSLTCTLGCPTGNETSQGVTGNFIGLMCAHLDSTERANYND